MNRKNAIKGILASALGVPVARDAIYNNSDAPQPFIRNEQALSGGVSSKISQQGYRHSVCRWTYSSVTLEELCEVAIDLNIDSIELLNPSDIKKVQQRGLNCAVANSVPLSLTDVCHRLRPYCFFSSKAWYYSRYGVIEFEGRS